MTIDTDEDSSTTKICALELAFAEVGRQSLPVTPPSMRARMARNSHNATWKAPSCCWRCLLGCCCAYWGPCVIWLPALAVWVRAGAPTFGQAFESSPLLTPFRPQLCRLCAPGCALKGHFRSPKSHLPCCVICSCHSLLIGAAVAASRRAKKDGSIDCSRGS